jgi:tRNA dimethylallyltransferase
MGYHRDMVSMQGLGYKEILDYLDNKCSLDEAVATIKLETRHFAKRQLTWFRREREVIWMDKSQFYYNEKVVLDEMCRILKAKGII